MIENISLAQINTTVGDFSGNLKKIISFAERAKSSGADLVCFPELALCGYPPRDLLFRSAFLRYNKKSLEELCKRVTGVDLIVGYASSQSKEKGKRVRNSLAWIRDGEVIYQYDKNLLPVYDVFDEQRHFESGLPPEAFDDLVLTICEDIWYAPELESDFLANDYEERPLDQVVMEDETVVLNSAASPFVRGKEEFRDELFAHLAQRYETPLLFCNQVGGNDSLIFDGNSRICNESGKIIARGAPFEEDLLIVERRQLFDDNVNEKVISPATDFPRKEEATIYRALELGLSDYLEKCGFDKVLLGLSGGIDSSLAATIAADALGPENALGVLMPSQVTSSESVEHAEQLVDNLEIDSRLYKIEKLFDDYLDLLQDDFEETEWDTTEENIQARIRGNILMALSNKFDYLLISPGNKSELAVGYCTLYGDMTGGLALLSDVPKTMVYRLAEYRNERSAVIPEVILQKPPSAELSPGQKDEDDLPPYEVLDRLIELYVEKHLSMREMIETGFEPGLVREVVRKIDYNEYKRQQAPIGFKVTSKSFATGWEMPIAQKFIP